MENTYFIEMPDDYHDLSETYHRQFAPEGPEESELVNTMVYDMWLRNRAIEFLKSHSYDPAVPGLNDMIDLATQRLPDLERHHAKNLSILRKLQKRRIGAAKPAKLASFVKNAPQPPRPPAPPRTASGEWIN